MANFIQKLSYEVFALFSSSSPTSLIFSFMEKNSIHFWLKQYFQLLPVAEALAQELRQDERDVVKFNTWTLNFLKGP